MSRIPTFRYLRQLIFPARSLSLNLSFWLFRRVLNRNKSAYDLALSLIRPFGFISSVGESNRRISLSLFFSHLSLPSQSHPQPPLPLSRVFLPYRRPLFSFTHLRSSSLRPQHPLLLRPLSRSINLPRGSGGPSSKQGSLPRSRGRRAGKWVRFALDGLEGCS